MTLNNIIVMNRGDTYEFDLTMADDSSTDGRYHLVENDAVYFGLMHPHQPFEVALVRKKFIATDADEAGNLSITITPEDTIDLLPGTYYYAIKLVMDHDEIDPTTGEPSGAHINQVVTVINKTKFIICD